MKHPVHTSVCLHMRLFQCFAYVREVSVVVSSEIQHIKVAQPCEKEGFCKHLTFSVCLVNLIIKQTSYEVLLAACWLATRWVMHLCVAQVEHTSGRHQELASEQALALRSLCDLGLVEQAADAQSHRHHVQDTVCILFTDTARVNTFAATKCGATLS